jgi:FADH2 O2-dependent halogenase
MPRISRLWSAAAGSRWLALPSTIGVIDPLHSTGLAHALSGVDRAAEILLQMACPSEQRTQLERYRDSVVNEVRWIDQLVAICYAALPDFELFTTVCSFYFLSAIECEREMSETGVCRDGFLGAGNAKWRSLVAVARSQLASRQPHASLADKRRFIDEIRTSIDPWNSAGLLNPQQRNRYARTAAAK